MIKDLKLKLNKVCHRQATTADGKLQPILGSCDIPIQISGVCRIVNFLAVPSVEHSIIVGSDFCNLFQVNVDYKDGRWTIQCKENPLSVDYQSFQLSALQMIQSHSFTPEEQIQVDNVLASFKRINGSDTFLGRTDKLIHHIDTGDEKPFKQRQYPFSPILMQHLNKELDKMLELGIIERSHGSWSSPVLLVKKASGEYRFCFDGRALNAVTKPDRYPLPRVDRILSLLTDAHFISSIDLKSAFWQIPLDEESKDRTGFAIPGRGMFRFTVTPFGLCNAAQTQQRLMDAIFGPELEPFVFCYLDDIIVISKAFDQYVELLSTVCNRLKEAHLTINFKKCHFFRKSLKYLGYIVDENGLRTDPDKVSAMLNYPRPTTSTEIKRFVGMCSWYRRFIQHFSTLMAPINDLLKGKKKKQHIEWTTDAEKSFITIKQALVSAPILRSPDFSKGFTIQCDASDTGVGGVLTLVSDGEEVVIAFCSRSLSKAERNYSVTERELVALLFSLEKFRPYVEGTHFKEITDHYSLLWLRGLKEPTGKLARWAIKLQQYSFDMEHRKGKLHVVPDALSRSFPTVSAIAVDMENLDPWYKKMQKDVNKEPQKYPGWKLENNVLYKYFPNKRAVKTNGVEWKAVVPTSLRKNIIHQCHDLAVSGHFGYYKTLGRVQEDYYWPKMRGDILKYIKSCHVCGEQKHVNEARMGLMGREKKVRYPFQFLAVDMMGPFPRSSQGNSYLLVAADWFTKYTLLCPMRKANAAKIVNFLENEIFLVYGVPQVIICDNGTEFNNNSLKKLVQKYDIQKIWYNAKYHPQCNFVERINKTVGTAIRSYIKENQRLWDQHVSEIQYAVNTAKHEATGYAPVYLNFGRITPIRGDFYGKLPDDFRLFPENRDTYFEDLKKLSEVYENVRTKLNAAYIRNSSTYNLRKRDVVFEVGDRVWRRNKVLSNAATGFSAKLAPKYVLCTIKNKISRLVYQLTNADGSDAGNWHIKDLKRCFASDESINSLT